MSLNVNSGSQSFGNYLNDLENKIHDNPTGKAAQKVFDNIIESYEQLTVHADHLTGLSGERITTDGLNPEDLERFSQIAAKFLASIDNKDDNEMLIQAAQTFRQQIKTDMKQEGNSIWDNYQKTLEKALPLAQSKEQIANSNLATERKKNDKTNKVRLVVSYILYGASLTSTALAVGLYMTGIGIPIALGIYGLSLIFAYVAGKLNKPIDTPKFIQAENDWIQASIELDNVKMAHVDPRFIEDLVTSFGHKIKENNLTPLEANPIFKKVYHEIEEYNKNVAYGEEVDYRGINDEHYKTWSDRIQKLIDESKAKKVG